MFHKCSNVSLYFALYRLKKEKFDHTNKNDNLMGFVLHTKRINGIKLGHFKEFDVLMLF